MQNIQSFFEICNLLHLKQAKLNGLSEQNPDAGYFEYSSTIGRIKQHQLIPFNVAGSGSVPNPRLVLAYGPNAAGKSLIGKIVEGYLYKNGNGSARSVSMRNRTSGAMGQRFIFGDEAEGSTGINSLMACDTALRSVEKENGGVIIFDEPDLGVCDEFSVVLGQRIAEHINKIENFSAVVMSHNKQLVRAICNGLEDQVQVQTLAFSPYPVDIFEWLNEVNQKICTWDDIIQAEKRSFKMSCAIERFLKSQN